MTEHEPLPPEVRREFLKADALLAACLACLGGVAVGGPLWLGALGAGCWLTGWIILRNVK